MIAAMNEVGRRFEAGDYYVPEMLVAASAMQAALFLRRKVLAIFQSFSVVPRR
jgi:5-methyltetrahydrofolate--homocysteine methyltransferase